MTFLRVAIPLLLISAPAAFGATEITDNSVSANESSAPMVSTKYHSYDEREKSGVSRVTPVTGFDVTNFVGDNTGAWKPKVGAILGATIDVGYSSFVFETGLLFRQLGAETSAENANTDNTFFVSSNSNVQFNLNYLAVPVGFKWYVGGQEGGTVFLKAGLLPQLLISKSQTDAYYYTYSSTSSNFPNPNSFDLDAYAGLGGKIAINDKIDIMIDGTYSQGLTKFNNDSNGNIYNSGFTLGAGVGFAL